MFHCSFNIQNVLTGYELPRLHFTIYVILAGPLCSLVTLVSYSFSAGNVSDRVLVVDMDSQPRFQSLSLDRQGGLPLRADPERLRVRAMPDPVGLEALRALPDWQDNTLIGGSLDDTLTAGDHCPDEESIDLQSSTKGEDGSSSATPRRVCTFLPLFACDTSVGKGDSRHGVRPYACTLPTMSGVSLLTRNAHGCPCAASKHRIPHEEVVNAQFCNPVLFVLFPFCFRTRAAAAVVKTGPDRHRCAGTSDEAIVGEAREK